MLISKLDQSKETRMSVDRRPRSGRRSSIINASHYRSAARLPPVIWNLQGVRGQMSTNCLWHACRALGVGIILFGIGTVMCISGFYADGVFDDKSNSTTTFISREMYFRDPNRHVKFSKLSYIGPIVMGVGGFIIVATCVMTFEARDSAAKVGPATIGTSTSTSSTTVYPLRNKNRREVRSVASQTQSSSLSSSTLQLFDRKHIMDAFRKFSKTLRSSASVTSWQGEQQQQQLHRSPSAPSLLSTTVAIRRGSATNISSTRRFVQKTRTRVPSALLRQTMSVDCTHVSSMPPLSIRQNSSTQTLELPIHPGSQLSKMYPTSAHSHPRIYRGIYSTSSECNPSTTSNTTLNGDGGECSMTASKLRFENESILRNVNASVHFDPETSEVLSNGLTTLSLLKPVGSGLGSQTSLRTLSPHPSYYSEDSFEMPSPRTEQVAKSPISQKSRLRSIEYSYNRPSLSRQSKVDYTEVVLIPDSEDEDRILPVVDDLTTIPE